MAKLIRAGAPKPAYYPIVTELMFDNEGFIVTAEVSSVAGTMAVLIVKPSPDGDRGRDTCVVLNHEVMHGFLRRVKSWQAKTPYADEVIEVLGGYAEAAVPFLKH
jgi:hypothetical protein